MGLVRELAQKLSHLTNSAARQELLETLHQRVHCLSVSTTRPELQPAAQLSAALEGLLKKISQQDDRVTPSALKAVVDAVDLLQELYEDRVETELATEPPIALLVVDDDPIARRVMTGALQIAFGKPDAVEDGPSALALAEKKAFDVMFLDVQMPGMDGFELCPKLHKIPLNRNTPVVFVTGYTDLKFREMSRLSGGTDFISKPILASEVKLKALTMALQRRLYARRHPGEVEADSEDRAAEGSAAGVNVESAAPVAA